MKLMPGGWITGYLIQSNCLEKGSSYSLETSDQNEMTSKILVEGQVVSKWKILPTSIFCYKFVV